MIGNSKDEYKSDDDEYKSQRSGYLPGYPITLHSRPYQAYGSYGSYGGSPSYTPPTSLISANIHLLEPFMLITFLLFVLTLVDRARSPSLLSRKDVIHDLTNYTNAGAFDFDGHHHPYRFFKNLRKRNETDF